MTGQANRFDADTAVERVGPTSFESHLDRRWWVARGPHGGYLAAIVLRALIETIGDPDRSPRSLTLHYLAAPEEGPVRVDTVVERSGRSLSSLSARMLQGERLMAIALAAFSTPWPGLEFMDARMPQADDPETLPVISEGEGRPPFLQNFDLRWGVGAPPFSGGSHAHSGGWMRLADPRPVDHVAAAALMDAWIPAPFSRLSRRVAAPTIDLTIHFRTPLPLPGAEADDFVLGSFRSQVASEGFFEEDGELWSRDGVLIAQSRQLALLLPVAG